MVTFGGCRDDFMIVLSQSVTKEVPKEQREHGTEKLLFAMTKTKVALVADKALTESGTTYVTK